MKNKTLLAAALCASLFAAGSVQADDDVTLRFSNATNVAAKDAAVDLMDVAKKESDGTIKIKHFPDNMLGDDRVATDCYAWEAPFLFKNADEGIKCFSSELASKINNQVEKKGLKVLAMVGNGFRNYTNNKVAVKVPSDVKGQKVRVMETDIQMAMWQAWGANPTPMAFAELLPALQQGTVDAQENPLAIIDANKLYEVQHYISLTGHLYSPQIMLMNKAKYDSLSEKQQKAIDDAVKAFVAKHRQRSVELDNMSIDKFKKAGCEVVELNDADRAQWQKTAVDAGVYDLIKSKMDHPEYLDQIINKQY